MKFKNPLLAAADMERSKNFYRRGPGLRVVMDFGANITLTAGICLRTRDSWKNFFGAEGWNIAFGGRGSELYFV